MFQHPGFQLLLYLLLMPWPLVRLYKRVGLSPFWVLLLVADIFVPFLGMLLVLVPITLKAWPNFPKAPPPRLPIKRPI
jgi:hypothetical protein